LAAGLEDAERRRAQGSLYAVSRHSPARTLGTQELPVHDPYLGTPEVGDDQAVNLTLSVLARHEAVFVEEQALPSGDPRLGVLPPC